jgi:hypothetical protein
MGKAEPRKTRGVVGIEEDSEDDDKPLAQVTHRQVGWLLLLLLLLFSCVQQHLVSQMPVVCTAPHSKGLFHTMYHVRFAVAEP